MAFRASFVGGLLALSLATPAFATPAQNLFDQATFLIGFNYHGPATVPNFRELRRQYQPQLDRLCAGDANCGYDKARTVIQGIIQGLSDPFTQFMTRAQLRDDERYGAGLGPASARVGVWAREAAGGLVVLEAFPGEPAFEAGLRRGDLITQIGADPATPARLAAAEAGQGAVAVAYTRQGQARSANLTPRVAQQTMRPRLEVTNGIAYLRVYHLYASGEADYSTAGEVHRLVGQAERQGARAMVLDLRDSLSGYDTEALEAAGAFADKLGFIYDRRFEGQDETLTVEGGRLFTQPQGGERTSSGGVSQPVLSKIPLVILVNRNTLNSSEMLAYFLQKAGRAKVVGEPTAGALGMSGGAEGPLISGEFIAVSSLRMRGLDGSPFPLKLTPDVAVPEDLAALAAGRDPALERALELLR